MKDIKTALMNGEIIEDYPDDFPFPSCLILGKNIDGKPVHICVSDEGNGGRIITVYFPSTEKWQTDFKTRKDIKK